MAEKQSATEKKKKRREIYDLAPFRSSDFFVNSLIFFHFFSFTLPKIEFFLQ